MGLSRLRGCAVCNDVREAPKHLAILPNGELWPSRNARTGPQLTARHGGHGRSMTTPWITSPSVGSGRARGA